MIAKLTSPYPPSLVDDDPEAAATEWGLDPASQDLATRADKPSARRGAARPPITEEFGPDEQDTLPDAPLPTWPDRVA